MKYLLSILVMVFLAGCGSGYEKCKRLGYKGVVLYKGSATPERKCSDGLVQGGYYITNEGLFNTKIYTYYKEVK